MKQAIQNYLIKNNYPRLDIKAAFFDMDGVLFNSMPFHAESWKKALNDHGFPFELHDAYLCEGMTGSGVVNAIYKKYIGRSASEDEINEIYQTKYDYFNKISRIERIPYVLDLLNKLKLDGIDIYIVTGSGQKSLINKLESWFPGIFHTEKMVTAYDVTKGKPNPEPYLKALIKSGVKPNEAFVVENAPLGVRASVGAGIFTLAVNTGILTTKELEIECKNSGIVLPDMKAIINNYELLIK